MKNLLLIIAAMAVCLISCRTQKSAKVSDRRSTEWRVDTTGTVADTAGRRQTDTDTTKNRVIYEDVGIIEFVEGGGKVSVDKAGNVTFDGVKSARGKHKGSIAQDKGISQKIEETARHREQLNGVTDFRTRSDTQTTEAPPARKWYESAFARIGQGVCVAGLLWLLFLYLRRKF